MTAPIKLPPNPTELIGTVRTQEDLIEALRAAKEMRNLSFKVLDELGGFTQGHMERVIGPRREKGMSPFVFQMLCSLLAVKLEMVPDEDQARRMAAKWEGRDTSNVRLEKGRISKTLLERAAPHVFKAAGELGGKARARQLSPKQMSEIARKGGRARQRNRRKNMRERIKKRKLAAQCVAHAEGIATLER